MLDTKGNPRFENGELIQTEWATRTEGSKKWKYRVRKGNAFGEWIEYDRSKHWKWRVIEAGSSVIQEHFVLDLCAEGLDEVREIIKSHTEEIEAIENARRKSAMEASVAQGFQGPS